MRFEASRIHLTQPRLHFAELRLDAHRFSARIPKVAVRKLRLKQPLAALVLRPIAKLRPTLDGLEPRPTGFDKYDRRFTREGGIELEYRDVERSLPLYLGKSSLWFLSCLAVYYAGCAWSPIDGWWWNFFAHVVIMLALAGYFFRVTEVQRTVEIRPDCMIIEGVDVFWKENMQLGWPAFVPNDAGDFVLSGVYGSRWIEYLTIPRFDDNDRAPELFSAQLTNAMTYQWELPSKGA